MLAFEYLFMNTLKNISFYLAGLTIAVSPLINERLLAPELLYFTSYTALFVATIILAISTNSRFLLTLIAISILLGAASGSLALLGVGVAISNGILASRNFPRQQVTLFKYLLFANFAVCIAQTLNINNYFYILQNYGNHFVYDSLLQKIPSDINTFRPSGLYTSPTYLTLFNCTLFAVLTTGRPVPTRMTFFIAGTLFFLSGSTAALVLLALSIILIPSISHFKHLTFGYLTLGIFISVFNPDFIDYNFSAQDVIASFQSRFDLHMTGGENLLQRNLPYSLLFGGGGVLTIFALHSSRLLKTSPQALICLALSISLPLVLHDFIGSMIYLYFFFYTLGQALYNNRPQGG